MHYSSLINYSTRNKVWNKIFLEKYEQIKELQSKLKESIFFHFYITTIKNNLSNTFIGWWNEILTIKQINNYASKFDK